MRKGFTRKPQADDPATRGKNYITPGGLQRLKDEHGFLLTRERRAVTEVVAWAASNGDRSENASGPRKRRERGKRRRGRSRRQPHKLGVTSGPRADEGGSRRRRSSPSPRGKNT